MDRVAKKVKLFNYTTYVYTVQNEEGEAPLSYAHFPALFLGCRYKNGGWIQSSMVGGGELGIVLYEKFPQGHSLGVETVSGIGLGPQTSVPWKV